MWPILVIVLYVCSHEFNPPYEWYPHRNHSSVMEERNNNSMQISFDDWWDIETSLLHNCFSLQNQVNSWCYYSQFVTVIRPVRIRRTGLVYLHINYWYRPFRLLYVVRERLCIEIRDRFRFMDLIFPYGWPVVVCPHSLRDPPTPSPRPRLPDILVDDISTGVPS